MPKSTNLIEWCTVRIGEDLNWWVTEVSDDVHWDVDGLSIIDPRQISHMIDLVEPLRGYSFDQDTMDRAFIPFKIQKDLGEGLVRLQRTNESLLDTEESLFGLPDVIDDENGPYADFLNHISKIRVRMLNDIIDFEQPFTVDELEDELREEENNSFIEGRAVHMFDEITRILDYVPTGWELEGDETDEDEKDEVIDDYPDIDDEEAKKISESENLRWDEDEEEETKDEAYQGGPPDEEEAEEKD
ncbi:MAG: hypothetical protein MKZ70_09415 [Opitutales bacterium]|nr:hypothetical protein [Opitutales bacterium]MCH2614891.1 hypothetical protein [Opitutales bacterium]|tara:strand:+ start:490 stop:1221 length:732 start_codon:yes stop_codon:yes gene_type:complete